MVTSIDADIQIALIHKYTELAETLIAAAAPFVKPLTAEEREIVKRVEQFNETADTHSYLSRMLYANERFEDLPLHEQINRTDGQAHSLGVKCYRLASKVEDLEGIVMVTSRIPRDGRLTWKVSWTYGVTVEIEFMETTSAAPTEVDA